VCRCGHKSIEREAHRGGNASLSLFFFHPGVGNGKQQSPLDTGPDLINIDTTGDILVGGLPTDL